MDDTSKQARIFSRPAASSSSTTETPTKNKAFLSHRGPDTKERLVRPMSLMLSEGKVPHFFDQSKEHASGLPPGQENFKGIQYAVWNCMLGVAFLSQLFHKSSWCVWELNTLLHRWQHERNQQNPKKGFQLLLVYDDASLLKDEFYKKHLGSITGVIRKAGETDNQLLVRVMSSMFQMMEDVEAVPEPQLQNRLNSLCHELIDEKVVKHQQCLLEEEAQLHYYLPNYCSQQNYV